MMLRLNYVFAGFHASIQNRTCPEKPRYLWFIELISKFGISPVLKVGKLLVLAT